MPDIHHPDTTARDAAEQIMRDALGNIDIDAVVKHLAQDAGLNSFGDLAALTAAVKDADDILDWIHSAPTEIQFPGICAAQVRYMRNYDEFGPDGWTWCQVIDGEVDDFTLPRCADQTDAIAQAAEWLGKQKRVDPAFPAPVVETRIGESA